MHKNCFSDQGGAYTRKTTSQPRGVSTNRLPMVTEYYKDKGGNNYEF